ncbi:dipeptidyl aminopeptidase/acylaminoacyl peptidase [Undibacterium sp. GrIS 1.2]
MVNNYFNIKIMQNSPIKYVFSYFLKIAITIAFSSHTFAIAAEKPKIESFFTNAAMQKVTISPDGKIVAMLIESQSTGYLQLFTMDLDSMALKIVAGFSNADVGSYDWVNSQRLVYSAAFHDVAQRDLRFFPGLFAVNRDGTDRIELASPFPGEPRTTGSNIQSQKLTGYTWLISTDKSQQSDDVFVGQFTFSNIQDVKAVKLLRLNTKTGKSKNYSGPDSPTNWLIDESGTPRIAVKNSRGIDTIYYLDPKDTEWHKLTEFSQFDPKGFTPLSFTPDGKLYVISNAGNDTSSLYHYDLAKNTMDKEPLVKLDGYDFSGSLIIDEKKNRVIGVHHLTDASGTTWLDPELKEVQKKIDDLLPGTINRLSFPRGGASTYVVISAFSDTQPISYLLYKRDTGKLSGIGKSRPDIDAKEMSKQMFVHYSAKDGLSIPAYLTLPVGHDKKNLPLIVLVHGGPYVRGSQWGWDPEVQFLASRGYAVLQPEFRGSKGFGTQHLEAGFKQWGLKVQEDIADGARWAIANGYADSKRICIAGASYGGYATLMGLAKNPELFRCGFEWVGVTDINLMFESSWENDMSEEWQKYGMPVMIGDKVNDAAQLRATSPVNIAGQIKQPLLMAYGGQTDECRLNTEKISAMQLPRPTRKLNGYSTAMKVTAGSLLKIVLISGVM